MRIELESKEQRPSGAVMDEAEEQGAYRKLLNFTGKDAGEHWVRWFVFVKIEAVAVCLFFFKQKPNITFSLLGGKIKKISQQKIGSKTQTTWVHKGFWLFAHPK